MSDTRDALLAERTPGGYWVGELSTSALSTAVASSALAMVQKAGKGSFDSLIAGGLTWLAEHQNADGGWGEDLRSYVDPAWIGRGAPTASQTAWALLALLAAGEHGSPAVERGVRWLVDTQRADGTWDEPQFTGTGFPGDFYIAYHLYRVVFPVSALGRWVQGWDGGHRA